MNQDGERLYEFGCEALRQGGYKLTPARLIVLRMLALNGQQSIYTIVRDADVHLKLDQSTVYRTLETFEKFALVKRVDVPGERQTFFQLNYTAECHMVVCRECGKVEFNYDCPCGEINAEAEHIAGFSAVSHKLFFSVVCRSCFEKGEPLPPGEAVGLDFLFPDASLEEAYELGASILKYHGLKLTKSRAWIMKQLISAKKPVSVSYFLDHEENKGEIDQSTVYRTLQSFLRFGLVNMVRVESERRACFEWAYPGNFHHIFCESCGSQKILQVPDRTDLIRKYGLLRGYFEVRHHLEYHGKCPQCTPKS